MSFLYPFTITVKRVGVTTTPGKQVYSGERQQNETVVTGLQNVPAHIQVQSAGSPSPVGLPADTKGEPLWLIIFKLPFDAVQKSDIIYDQLNRRFQVIAADPGPMVTTAICKKLEA